MKLAKGLRDSLLPVISEKEAFYGYIVGLSVGLWHEVSDWDRTLYAMFEYGDSISVWVVPDAELFKILSEHLYSMAWHRKETDDYGYAKLWIEKKDGKWIVDLP